MNPRKVIVSFVVAASISSPILGAGEEEAVKDALVSLLDAIREQDGERALRFFDFARMHEEIGEIAGVPASQRQAVRAGLELGLSRNITAGKFPWNLVHTLRVTLNDDRTEAIAFYLIRIARSKSLYRYWLIRRDGWKVYDYEALNDGLRYTSVLQSILAVAFSDPAEVQRLQGAAASLRRANEAVLVGDGATALEILGNVDRNGLPEFLERGLAAAEASALVQLERHPEALELVENAIERYRDLPSLLHIKASTLLGLGRYEESIRGNRKFIEVVGDDPDAWLSIGAAHEGLGEMEKAIDAYRKGIASDPEDSDNRFNLAVLLLERGEVEEAGRIFRESLQNAPDRPVCFCSAARRLHAAGANKELVTLSEDYAKKAPGDPNSYYYRGVARRRLGRYEEAEKDLRRGLEIDAEEERWVYYDELAFTLAHLGRREEALAFAARLDSENPSWAEYTRGYVHAATGEREQALAAVSRALRLDPELAATVRSEEVFRPLLADSEGRRILARADAEAAYDAEVAELLDSGDWEALLARSKKRAIEDPDDADALYYQGYALEELERYEEAERAYRAGLAKDSGDERPYYWQRLGEVLSRRGRTDEALDLAGKLLALKGWRPAGLRVRACAEARAGQDEKALETLRALLEVTPGCAWDVEAEPAFEKLRVNPACRDLLDKAKAEAEVAGDDE